jgi:Protein of unknown function (DUF2442)
MGVASQRRAAEELGSVSGTGSGYSDRSLGVIIVAVWSIIRFNVLPNYKIEVSFADGTSGLADLAPRLSQGPLGDGFDPLCDEKVFAQAYLEHGALTWPGGIDLAPDAMYQRIRASGTSVLNGRNKRVA